MKQVKVDEAKLKQDMSKLPEDMKKSLLELLLKVEWCGEHGSCPTCRRCPNCWKERSAWARPESEGPFPGHMDNCKLKAGIDQLKKELGQ